MRAKVLGIQKLDFSDGSGNTVKGTKIYCAFSDENVDGKMTDNYFIRSDSSIDTSEVTVNCDVEIYYNRKGKLSSLKVLAASQKIPKA